MKQDCSCLCGASRFTVDGKPIGRFFCHCAICQKVFRKPFSDATYFWAEAVALPGDQPVEFRRYRPPPALRRGNMRQMHEPRRRAPDTWSPDVRLAFVPSQNFPEPAELPAPDRHIFYHRRVADISNSVPKLSGYWPSEAHIIGMVLGKLPGRKSVA